nr:ABC transporter substrate-binding protein [Candidatus Krumholzibacteria bacterium]
MNTWKVKSRWFPTLGLVGWLLLSSLPGCGKNADLRTDPHLEGIENHLWPAPDGLVDDRPDCTGPTVDTAPGGVFTIAITDTVSPGRAPVPHNAGERLIFAQLYETLVNVDCAGNIQPGLADHWACTNDSTVWVFTLRADARLWDGTRVTPEVIKQAWTANQDCPRQRQAASPWSWFSARAKTVTILDGRRLAIQLPEPQATFPVLLSHPATAIALTRPGWQWPVGSGPVRLRAATPAVLPQIICRPNPHHPDAPRWEQMVFDLHPGQDPRDLVSSQFDLLLVRDLDSLRFFQQTPDFETHRLPWDQVYLLVISPDLAAQASRWTAAAQRLDPATDLTTVSAQRWPAIILPDGPPVDCPQLAGPVAMSRSARREWNLPAQQLDGRTLVYCTDDHVAQEMAHRLMALADDQARLVSLEAPAAAFSLEWQMAGAHLVRLDQAFASRCLQAAMLMGKAAWLQELGLGTGQPLGGESIVAAARNQRLADIDPLQQLRTHVQPLAVTRPWLVVRRGLAGWTLAYDGTPLLHGLGLGRETAAAPPPAARVLP